MKLSIAEKSDFGKYHFHIFPVLKKEELKKLLIRFPEAEKLSREYNFKGKPGEILSFNPSDHKDRYVAFIGAIKIIDCDNFRKLALNCISESKRIKAESALIHFPDLPELREEFLTNYVDFFHLNIYSFKKYKSKYKRSNRLKRVGLFFGGQNISGKSLEERIEINEILCEIRDIVNETPSKITPDFLVEYAQKISGGSNELSINVLRRTELKNLKLNGLLNVGRSSPYEPALICIDYNPRKFKKTISLVGKGITFDSGGLNIKTGMHMKSMKSDMAGAATVFGIIKLISKQKLNIRISAYIPVAENMPGRSSYKPDDIIQFSNNKSVEVVNTDAEGRLILADALIMASREKSDAIIEFSTLTGSIVTALGESFAGLMSNNKRLSSMLLNSSKKTGERLWEMPLHNDYKKSIESDIADLKNANYGFASSIKAALFLKEFIKNRNFVHIDMAGTAFLNKRNEYFLDKGATGFGIRLIFHFMKSFTKN